MLRIFLGQASGQGFSFAVALLLVKVRQHVMVLCARLVV